MIGSTRGINGKNSFGESPSKQNSMFSFNVTPFFNSGSVSMNSNSKSDSEHIQPQPGGSGSSQTKYYQFGMLEENGYFNASGLFYDFADPSFAKIGTDITLFYPTIDPLVGTEQDKPYYPAISYFAPMGFDFSDVKKNNGNGQGNLMAGMNLINQADWTSVKYGNFYRFFVKTAFPGLPENQLPLLNHHSLGNAQGGLDNPAYPQNMDDVIIKNNLTPGSTTFLQPGEKDSSASLIFLNPSINKRGARLNLTCTPFEGVVVNAKIGAGEIYVVPSDRKSVASKITGSSLQQLELISDMSRLELVMNDLGFTLKDYHLQGLEDAYVSCIAGMPFDLKDIEGDTQASVYPFVSAGVWIPTSKNYEKAFGNAFALYVPMGNEGHFGFSLSGGLSLNWDNMFCATCGAGATIFNEISLKDYRMPNNEHQRGLYPFKIDIKRKKGKTFFGYASLKSIGFDEGSSFYCDLIYASHEKDTITLSSTNSGKNEAFAKGKILFEELSRWHTQEFVAGINFNYFQDFQFGIGFTTNISGSSMPKMKNIFTDFTFIF